MSEDTTTKQFKSAIVSIQVKYGMFDNRDTQALMDAYIAGMQHARDMVKEVNDGE